MSVFDWIGSLFKPASDLVDELHYSGEEKGAIENKRAELRNKLAEIEAKVATRTLDLQSQIIEAEAKIEMSVQKHGNWLSKSVRPTITLGNWVIMLLMALGKIPFNEYIVVVCGGYNAHYTHLRTQEKKAGITR